MSKETRNRIHFIYGIILIAVTVIAGICFIASCLTLYRTGVAQGTDPYSRKLVGKTFSRIAIPVYACLVLVIGSFVLHLLLPPEKKKLAPEKNLPLILDRLRAKTALEQCDESLRGAIAAKQKSRKLHILISAALTAVCSVIFLIYACNGNNWGPVAEVTDYMIKAMYWFVPCVAIPLAYIIFTAYFCRNSLRQEIELMRQASAQAPKKTEKPEPKAENAILTLTLRLVLVALGIGFVIYGVVGEGVEAVIAKAVAICTECIGLG